MAETAIIELAHVRATNQEASEVNKMKVSSDLASLAAETAPTFVSADAEVVSLASSISEHTPSLSVKVWDKKTMFADYVRDSLSFQGRQHRDVVMLFESPSTSCSTSSFFNSQVYKFHDYPPAKSSFCKTTLGPLRYAVMNGGTYATYLQVGSPEAGLLDHWEATVPGFQSPRFVSEIPDSSQVFAYLPCESIKNHVNDPHIHYHMAGKDAIHLMTDKTTKLLQSTKVQRPCIAKTTHSMGSKGIFIIRNDEDEAEFEAFLRDSGNPTYVITEFVDIDRNVACHFFVHPSGEITFFGSNENFKQANGRWSMDSYQVMADQDQLRQMQLPYVMDVAKYMLSLGFWGFCGVDVLFDKTGKGFLVDVNPRVTGSLPSLMVAQLMQEKHGFQYGLFRRNGNMTYHGSPQRLFEEVAQYNQEHEGHSIVVVFGACCMGEKTKVNIAVYGNDMTECLTTLNCFAKSAKWEPESV